MYPYRVIFVFVYAPNSDRASLITLKSVEIVLDLHSQRLAIGRIDSYK